VTNETDKTLTRQRNNVARKPRRPPSRFATYLSLTKPRLSSFVILSAAVGFAMAPVELVLSDFLLCIVGTSLTVASANAGNQWLEVEHDKKVSIHQQHVYTLLYFNSKILVIHRKNFCFCFCRQKPKKMSRTRLRALPRGLLQPRQALAFSISCGVLGTSILYFGRLCFAGGEQLLKSSSSS
jgi:protoheme IX farnesyltransferase